VQFATANYGSGAPPSLGLGLAVLFGVWAFNLGTWVLCCVAELNKLNVIMDVVLRSNQTGQDNQDEYETALKGALQDMKEATLFWQPFTRESGLRSYGMNIFVHFFIDMCASAALLIRVNSPWVQHHVPAFLKAGP